MLHSCLKSINIGQSVQAYSDEGSYLNEITLADIFAFFHKFMAIKLSCRRDTARCLVSLNISLSQSRSFQPSFPVGTRGHGVPNLILAVGTPCPHFRPARAPV